MSPGKYVLGNQWSWKYSVFERKKYTAIFPRLCLTASVSRQLLRPKVSFSHSHLGRQTQNLNECPMDLREVVAELLQRFTRATLYRAVTELSFARLL